MKSIHSVQAIALCALLFGSVFSAGVTHAESDADKSETEKPLVFVFQKQKQPDEIKSAADKVSEYLSKELGRPVEAKVPSGYAASVQALVSQKADFAYTSSLPFLLARRDGGAELLLVEERQDPSGAYRTEYDSIYVVAKDSPLNDMQDLEENIGDLRMVFTSPTSTSGYVFAYLRLVRDGVLKPKQDPKEVFKSVSFGGSYTRALEEVLAGRGDVCAVSYYAVEGPKSSKYLSPEQISKLRVIGRTPGVPTHLISARKGLNAPLKEKVKAALLKLSKERPELLADVYGTSRFVEADEDAHLKGTVEAVAHIGLPVDGFVN